MTEEGVNDHIDDTIIEVNAEEGGIAEISNEPIGNKYDGNA